MGEFSKWLLHEEQKELFELLFALALNVVFLALVALLLWPLGKAALAWRLLKAYWLFWILLSNTSLLLYRLQSWFRVDMYSHFNAYVISALVVSGFLQAGWSAFAALTARDYAADASLWVAFALYVVGFISCQVACAALAPYYGGQIYRYVNVILAAAAFVLFALLPAAARALYGWFFGLF